LSEISPFRAGYPQPERRNHVYRRHPAQAFEATPPKHLKPRREKVFGLARGFAHDRNARVRIETYVKAWNAKQKQEGQHQGPITAAYQRVLHVLLWHFMSYRDGLCFPSYETIAAKAPCCRDTVYEAIKVLEDTGVFTWVNRIDRVADRVKDLFGHWTKDYRFVRRSNVYMFRRTERQRPGRWTFDSLGSRDRRARHRPGGNAAELRAGPWRSRGKRASPDAA